LRQASCFVKVQPGREAEAVHALSAGGGSGELSALRERLQQQSDAVIVFGDEVRGAAVEELVRWGLTLPGRTRFVALGDYANSRGAADMGVLPHTLPGYFPVSDAAARERYESVWGAKIPSRPGRNIRSILAGAGSGEIKALLVFGSNPVKTFKLDKAALGRLNFLMVAELFLTPTAKLADVVLPATSFAEKAGTVTNTCGQVQATKKTMRKAGTRSDLEILLALARLLGQPLPYSSPDDVLREIIARVPGYAIALPGLLVGRALATRPEGMPPELERPDLVFSSRDSLFTSGSVSQNSWALNCVEESKESVGTIF